jgi:predicted phage tail protein
MVRSILGRIVRQNGGKLLDGAVERIVPVSPAAKSGIVGKIAGAALIRIATRSVPGAIIVTGGLIAKSLHDRRKAKRAKKAGTGDRPA